jgi:hypothetical protein
VTRRGAEGGFFLVAAAVLVVVGALLAAGIAELAAGEGDSSALRVESAHALAIAQSGLELAFRSHGPVATTSFGGGTFAVTQSGRRFTSTGRWGRATRVVSADAGFPYVERSRPAAASTVRFRVLNLASGPITLTGLTATWVSPAAYFEQVRAQVVGGADYGTVWNFALASNVRKGSGEVATFDPGSSVVVPARAILELRLVDFVSARTGPGSAVSMDDASLDVAVRSATETFALTTVRTP